MNQIVLLLLIALLFEWGEGQRSDIIIPRNPEERNHCIAYTTCSECLQQAGCAWCSEKVTICIILISNNPDRS